MRFAPLALALGLACLGLTRDVSIERGNSVAVSAITQPVWFAPIARRFEIEQADQIEVLVQFAAPVDSAASAAPAEAARAAVAKTRPAVRDRLTQLGLTILQQYDYTPDFLVRVRRSDLEGLAAVHDIVAVFPNLRSVAAEADATQRDASDIEKQQLSVTTEAIGARRAWEQGYDGTGQVVAYMDYGFYKSHEMLATGGTIILEACFSSSRQCPGGVAEIKGQSGAASSLAGCTDAECHHGTDTMAVGVGYTTPWVANSRNTSNTHLGVAPRASAIALATPGGTEADVLSALNYLIDVVNQRLLPTGKQLVAVSRSAGGDDIYGDFCYGYILAPAITTLRQLGVLTTFGSGNDGGLGRIQAPACIKNVITAAASSHDHQSVTSFTNRLFTVDVLAPGANIVAPDTTSPTSYREVNGTSFSGPHTSGVIALLKSKSPNATSDEIEWALKRGSSRTATFQADAQQWSTPYIDVMGALAVLGQKPILGVPVAGFLPRTYTGGFNYARVYNPGTSAGTVNITLVRDDTGEALGTAAQQVPAHAAIQVQIETLQNSIGGTAVDVPATTTLSAYFDASFLGYAQNILWNAAAASLTNISSCADTQADTNTMLGNVHTALLSSTYPSSIRIHNAGYAAVRPTFDIYNAGTGVLLGSWQTPQTIQPGTARTYTAATAYSSIGFTPDANTYHTNFVLTSQSSLVVGHVVNNVGASLFTDMTPKCRI